MRTLRRPAQTLMDIQARMRAVLAAEAQAIANVRVDASYEAAVLALRDCTGKVMTTGMGKAGHIARKFAATLSSTATPAVFVHPAESAHGDLGVLSHEDCIIALSTSGKSREVLEMLEMVRHLGVKTIIGITSHPDSELRTLCDIVLDMGEIQEACPIGLTPSSSMAAMLAITDAIALALLEVKGITKEDFGMRHHGGYLGRKARLDNEPH